MSESLVLEKLSDVLGASMSPMPAGQSVLGSALPYRLEPDSGEKLSEVMRVLSAFEESVLVTGGMTKLRGLNAVKETRFQLSCCGLSGIDECDAADGVLLARAGTPLRDLVKATEESGWVLPFDPPGDEGTVGGVLATGMCGPRRLGFGAVRDSVLGLETVLANGDRTRCGARVVKNVTGYDMAKHYVGSLGTLAVIEGAWLRLKPKPNSVVQWSSSLNDSDDPHGLALAASRRSSARSVALLSEDLAREEPAFGEATRSNSSWRLLVEFSGDRAATRNDTDWLGQRTKSDSVGHEAIEALGRVQGLDQKRGFRVRLHLLPSALPKACGLLRDAGFRVLAYPEPAVIYGFLDDREGRESECLGFGFSALETVVEQTKATWVIESMPEASPFARDKFEMASGVPLMNALKLRFDPQLILNRGCFFDSASMVNK